MDILFHFKGKCASLLMKGSYLRSVILFSLYCVDVHRIENVLNVGSIVTCTICSCGIHMGNHILLGTASFFFLLCQLPICFGVELLEGHSV